MLCRWCSRFVPKGTEWIVRCRNRPPHLCPLGGKSVICAGCAGSSGTHPTVFTGFTAVTYAPLVTTTGSSAAAVPSTVWAGCTLEVAPSVRVTPPLRYTVAVIAPGVPGRITTYRSPPGTFPPGHAEAMQIWDSIVGTGMSWKSNSVGGGGSSAVPANSPLFLMGQGTSPKKTLYQHFQHFHVGHYRTAPTGTDDRVFYRIDTSTRDRVGRPVTKAAPPRNRTCGFPAYGSSERV